MIGMQHSEEIGDKELEDTATPKSEKRVNFECHSTNPFEVEANKLVSLASGATVPDDIETSFG